MRNSNEPILKRQITPTMCVQIVHYLTRVRHWSASRIGKTIHASPDFVRRVGRGQQCFEFADLQAIGRVAGLTPHLLVFRSVRREKLPDDLKDLYDMTRDLVESGEQFKRVMNRRNPLKRRGGTRAA